MADIKYYDVILSPVITEKSMNAMAEKKYTFYVHTDATKSQVADAVEKMFEGAKVESVKSIYLDHPYKEGDKLTLSFDISDGILYDFESERRIST